MNLFTPRTIPFDEREKRIIATIVRAGKLAGAQQIILFGSRARDDFQEESDFDFMFVFEDEKERIAGERTINEDPLVEMLESGGTVQLFYAHRGSSDMSLLRASKIEDGPEESVAQIQLYP